MATNTLELKIPMHSSIVQPAQMKRAVVSYLLHEELITMPDAISMLLPDDQASLVERLIQDAEKSLSLATQLTDLPMRQQYWQQYSVLLSYLSHWREHWSRYHGQLLATLSMVVRRYPSEQLTAKQFKVMSNLTHRLYAEKLYREDVFAAIHALQDVGLDTLLDLSPSDNSLADSYLEELGRA